MKVIKFKNKYQEEGYTDREKNKTTWDNPYEKTGEGQEETERHLDWLSGWFMLDIKISGGPKRKKTSANKL